jgi:hypothetical protein
MDRNSFFKQAFSLLKKAAVPKTAITEQTPPPAPEDVSDPSALTSIEIGYCNKAGLHPDTGIFLKQLTKRPIEKLVFEDYDTETTKPSGICSVTTDENARALVFQYRDELFQKGQFIYLRAIVDIGYSVGILSATTDPYEIIKLTETHGINHGIMTDDIIAKLKKWDTEFGLRLFGIGTDFCEGEIINKDLDYMALAREVYAFCPDSVDQGATDTVEALAEELKRTGSIFLWWD